MASLRKPQEGCYVCKMSCHKRCCSLPATLFIISSDRIAIAAITHLYGECISCTDHTLIYSGSHKDTSFCSFCSQMCVAPLSISCLSMAVCAPHRGECYQLAWTNVYERNGHSVLSIGNIYLYI